MKQEMESELQLELEDQATTFLMEKQKAKTITDDAMSHLNGVANGIGDHITPTSNHKVINKNQSCAMKIEHSTVICDTNATQSESNTNSGKPLSTTDCDISSINSNASVNVDHENTIGKFEELSISKTNSCASSQSTDAIPDVPVDSNFAQKTFSGDLKDTCTSDCDTNKVESHEETESEINYVVYKSELQMRDIMTLITKDLSEPYSIYTYRYFIHNWPKLCFLALDGTQCVGAIVCKSDQHKKIVRRGYIAMLAIEEGYRRRGIGSNLVTKAIRAMIEDECDEVVLETEITNKGALRLYENLGFVRDKRLFRYYLNGVDALRLKLWLR